MKCFYHPDTDGVGVCQQCGKFCCKQCIEDVPGQMLCKGCIELARQSRITEERETRQNALAQAEDVRRLAAKRIKQSWIFAITFGILGFLICLAAPANSKNGLPLPPYLMGPLSAYTWWGVFWGFVWFWPRWRDSVQKFKRALGGWILIARPFTWFIIFLFYLGVYLSVPFAIAVYYGIFGGGFYQYKKHKKLAAGLAASPVGAAPPQPNQPDNVLNAVAGTAPRLAPAASPGVSPESNLSKKKLPLIAVGAALALCIAVAAWLGISRHAQVGKPATVPSAKPPLSKQSVPNANVATAPKVAPKTPSPAPTDAHPRAYVTDSAGVINTATSARLNKVCGEVERKTGAQIVVVTVLSLEGKPVENYATDLFNRMGVGRKESRGVLLLVAPRDRKYHIQVGHGLVQVITNAHASDIARAMVPQLKRGDYSGAADLGVNRLAALIGSPRQNQRRKSGL